MSLRDKGIWPIEGDVSVPGVKGSTKVWFTTLPDGDAIIRRSDLVEWLRARSVELCPPNATIWNACETCEARAVECEWIAGQFSALLQEADDEQ